MRKPKAKIKLKSNRAAKKRFKLTASGKVKRHQSMTRHNLTKKATGRKRSLRSAVMVSDADTPHVVKMLLG